ncbi:hypothetical protein, variant [Aphanomyces invadans]|uniref:Uncharacterized protein n=1 Tax=Aphanomyces invadans TaxID=157072 RepID=A0A024TGT4_9STRA|nr:hypothetical protein, variant [Aphanomyces invadans]ETV93219.1 hypothetical protein, variant [Aphanomyces invadans]|eukprot:XP_008878240.1 hypothetical protein, variant [Aphanomyces invadans]
MRRALEAAASVLSCGGDALSACQRAVVELENAACTNAGGNGPHVSLTTQGRIETDASVMSGATNAIGCCGAVEGVRNPVTLAVHLLRCQQSGLHSATDRQPPSFLVGRGALAEAKLANLATIDYHTEPVHPNALAQHRDHATKHMLNGSLDTVGAICLDSAGLAVAAVSSAGIALKRPGRVGHAGCPRMGCCAANSSSTRPAFAFSATGRGEHIVQGSLLQHMERQMSSMSENRRVLHDAIHEAFQDAKTSNGDVPVEGGVIGFVSPGNKGSSTKKRRLPSDDGLEFLAAFTTPSMGIGVYSSADDAPHVSSSLEFKLSNVVD